MLVNVIMIVVGIVFSCIFVGLLKFFAAFQPCVRGNECFVGSDNKYLVF